MESQCSDNIEKFNLLLSRRNKLRQKLAILKQARTQRLQTSANLKNVPARNGEGKAEQSMVTSRSTLQEVVDTSASGLNNTCAYEDHEAEIERIERVSRLLAETTTAQSSDEDFSDSGSEYRPSDDDSSSVTLSVEENHYILEIVADGDNREQLYIPDPVMLPQKENETIQEILYDGDNREQLHVPDPVMLPQQESQPIQEILGNGDNREQLHVPDPVMLPQQESQPIQEILGNGDNREQLHVPDPVMLPQEENHPIQEILADNDSRKRRRVPDPSNWKRTKAKLLRMKGKEYIGFKRHNNKVIHNEPRQARKLGPKCNLKLCAKSSKRKCDTLSEDQRKDIFTKFWSEMDWGQRKIYAINHVKKMTPLRRYSKDTVSNRNESLFYHLTVNSDTLQVCKKTFLGTLGIGEFTVRNWIKTSKHGMLAAQQRETVPTNQNQPNHPTINQPNDQVGNRPGNPRNRGGKRELIMEFFDTLPKLPSHYARKETSKQYLQEDIKTHTQLYKIYKQYCMDANKCEKIGSRKLFDEAFFVKNLSIYTLKKDKCDVCEGYKSGNIEEEVYRVHTQKKERAREEKAYDKECALKDQCTVLTMDLQALKMAPFLNCNGYYYKTKLCCHNFTVFNLKTHHTKCYWFTECDAELGASTYASCVIDYLNEFCAEEKNKIVIYSDGCTAQNRNVTLANALLDYSIKTKVIVQQKYLEVGHTQMECDSVHAAIERRLKNREIHLPSEYGKISREARVKPFPYDVKLLDYTFFKNYAAAEVQRYTSIRPGKKKGDPCVTDIRAIQYNPSGNITVKLHYDEEFQELPHRPKHREEVNWDQLYTSQLKITASKWSHLQELKFALPADTHHFYDNLPHE